MHANSRRLMAGLLTQYAPATTELIYDIGSRDVNGNYRALAAARGRYVGVDIEAGRNVDLVVPEESPWLLPPAELAISGQCLEHVRRPWNWIRQIRDILKPGGIVILIAPHTFPEHRYPVDCWRVFPDGMQALLEWGGFQVQATGTSCADCYGVGKAADVAP